MVQLTIQQAFDLAVQHHEARRLREAEQFYRQILEQQPTHANAMHHLGVLAYQVGRIDAALDLFRRAVNLNPDYSEAHNSLGNVLKEQGQLNEAIVAYRRAIALRPSLPEAHNNLGIVLTETGKVDEAIAALRQAISLNPRLAEAHGNLGIALKQSGQFQEAIASYQQAIALKPNYAEAYSNLGNVLRDQQRLDEAAAAFRQAIALNPNFPQAYNNLGNTLKDTGRLDEAIAAYRRAMELDRTFLTAHSNLIFTMLFHPGYDERAVREELGRWNYRHAEPLGKLIQPHGNERSAERRLRIGYVSPDFRNHCQALFMLPLLANHDRERVSVYCYSVGMSSGSMTDRHEQLAEVWRDCRGMGDQDLANLIRTDQIDILVDLSLHMGNNRLLVFARKPAPVQVTWLGYPGSTGLSTIDYRLSDPYIDPVGMDESIYSEQTVRLPDSFWCYDPLEGRDLAVNALPALKNERITFGCLNNFCKINDSLLSFWARVMKQVGHSQLMLLAPEGSHRQRILDRLQQEGIDAARIEFVSFQPRQKYLELYHRIDLGLDSFPSNGHTTSLDSFWMGVPVVTLVGKTAVSRAGWCQLSNLGLTELAARTPEGFVRIAVELARDLLRLGELRRTLRGRMERSPLMDAPKFARNMEAAFRRMWRTWCETAAARS